VIKHESTKPILIETQYLPNLEYFILLKSSHAVFIEHNEYYERQTYRNRAQIQFTNGVGDLTIPVKNGRKKILTKDIQIDNSQNWQKNHWRSIQSSYGKAPFFEFFVDGFNAIYEREYRYLTELNHDLLSYCLHLLSWKVEIKQTDQFIEPQDTDYQQFRSLISPKVDFHKRQIYQEVPYQQLFGAKFAPNLSIIDILFCEGPAASDLISSSAKL
jgi:hypothetical protein